MAPFVPIVGRDEVRDARGMELLGREALSLDDLGGLPQAEMLHDYLPSIPFTISGGATQVQRDISAERILELPREPRRRARSTAEAGNGIAGRVRPFEQARGYDR